MARRVAHQSSLLDRLLWRHKLILQAHAFVNQPGEIH